MSQTKETLTALMKEKALAIGAKVSEAATMDEAIAYAINLCSTKEPCQLVVTENGTTRLQQSDKRILSGAGLPEALYQKVAQEAEKNNIFLIHENLRNYLSGFDVALTIADMGIAETGTIVCNSTKEDARIATMVCEFHVAVLPKSKIFQSSFDVEPQLTEWMKNGPCYTAFISGPSRTADIERVLAIGVHGPLEMHIILLED